MWIQRWGWAAVGLCGASVLYALVVTFSVASGQPRSRPRPARSDLRFLVGLAMLFGTALFLATLPQDAPFSAGQGLGPSFLVGVIATLLAAWFLETAASFGATSLRESPSSLRGPLRLHPSAVVGGLVGWAALAALCGTRWLDPDLLTASPGAAAGAWFVAFVVGSPRSLGPSRKTSDRVPVRLLWILATFLSVLAFGTILATQNAAAFGTNPAARRSYILILAAGLVLALVLSGPLLPLPKVNSQTGSGNPQGRSVLPAAASLILLLVVSGSVAFFGARRLLESPVLSFPFLGGLLTGALALGLATAQVPGIGKENEGSFAASRQSFVLGLLLLGMVVAAFILQRGLGIALATLGFLTPVAWREIWEFAPADPDLSSSPGPLSFSLHLAVGFLILMILFRLFYERYPLRRGRADLYLQPPFIGLLGGMLVAFGVGALRMEIGARLQGSTSPSPQGKGDEVASSADLPIPVGAWLDWLLTGGVGMILAPALIALLWGAAGSAGFLAGLAVFAFLMGLLTPALRGLPLLALSETALVGLPLLGLVTLQGTHLLESASHATRNVKVIVLLIALGVAFLWSLGRWLSARRDRRGTAA